MDDDDDDALNLHARARGKILICVTHSFSASLEPHVLLSVFLHAKACEVSHCKSQFSSLSSILFNEHFYSIFLSSLIEARDTVIGFARAARSVILFLFGSK